MRADRFLRACRREAVDATPIWLMRQAGRYLEGFQALRKTHSFLELVHTPELAVEISLEPVRRFDLDAAIVFADILLPLEPMGLTLHFEAEGGPRIENPVRDEEDAGRLRPVDPRDGLGDVLETLRILRQELGGRVPLIGFAAAPFTLLSYAVEGETRRDAPSLKALMWGRPALFEALMRRMSEVTVAYLRSQVEAGAQALQLFDSWVGALSPLDYGRHVLPHTQAVIRGLRGTGVPVIHFAPLTTSYLDLVLETGADVLSVDWRADLTSVRREARGRAAVQGNLDPLLLKEGNPAQIREEARRILERAGPDAGHIFNLGHGVLPGTPPAHVGILVDAVHTFSALEGRPRR